ncbi:MAG: ABC transporter permease subunit [Pirellulaceae bacterium]|nr:ABC transporter permease subunit [Pirellulaceae bacterium]
MRPYLAVIKDSFREALASRVLWIVLSLILLHLALLAPLGIRLHPTTDFAWGDVLEGPQLVAKMRRAAAIGGASPGGRVWKFLDEATQAKLVELQHIERGDGGKFFQGMEALRTSLTNLIHRRDLYDATAFKNVSLGKEARDLQARGLDKLSDDELARFHRLAIEAAFPGHIRRRPPHSVSITYLVLESPTLPFSKEQADNFIKEWVISNEMSWIIGPLGMIAALLVTSTIIPQMFDPGSITLLLSKPVSKSLLFIAKFLGGCVFVLLSATLLISGQWLILGTRFGIWNHGILWCIPIFVFMFLIYYSVSALVGVVWKNAIISVVITVVFFLSCLVVYYAKGTVEGLFIDPERVVKIANAAGTIIVVRETGGMDVWDVERSRWQRTYEPQPGGRGVPTLEGPYYDALTGQLVAGQGYANPFGVAGQRITLRLGRATDGWALRDGPALPNGSATFLIENDGQLLAVAGDNLFRLHGKLEPAGQGMTILGFSIPSGGADFRPTLADSKLSFADPLAAAADPTGPRVAVASGSDIYVLNREPTGKYAVAAHRNLAGKEREGIAVAIGGESVVVAREDGQISLLAAKDLATRWQKTLVPYTQPRFVAAARDGSQFAILFQNHQLWLIDGTSGQARLAPLRGQGDISGFVFTKDHLLVADCVDRITTYDLKTLRPTDTRWQRMSQFELGYYYSLLPVYSIFPKPNELENTVHFVLTGKQTTDLGLFRGVLEQRRDHLDPWRPVVSGLIFVGLMLLIACIYIERHEF